MQMTRNTSQLLTRGPLYPRSRSQNVTNNSGSAATLVTRARVRMRDGKHLSAVSCDQWNEFSEIDRCVNWPQRKLMRISNMKGCDYCNHNQSVAVRSE